MNFKQPEEKDIRFFEEIIGADSVFTDEENRTRYGKDETEDLVFKPAVVLKASSTEQLSKILSYCNNELIPVTPIGARTGLSGGALCVHGGVALSMEKFNKILKIDLKNQQVITEPGVITQVLQEEVAKHDLYYAPDPASRGSCSIGGNIAENSGGPHALKYGVTKDFVLNLEVVLADGTVIWTGANTLKNSTGYNLTQLVVGSEGTLAVVTKAVLKLIPLPKSNMLMLVPFGDAIQACEAVSAIFNAGLVPSALEFMERDAIDLALKFVDDVKLPVGESVGAHLLIEVDGNNENVLMDECEQIAAIVEQYNAQEILFADSEAQKNELWKLRRKVGEAVKAHSTYKEEDTVVPRHSLPQLLAKVKELGKQYGFKSVCYGHAGDGNLHVNILKEDMNDENWQGMLPKAIRELFEYTYSLNGTISGEHGIGLVQKDYLNIVFLPKAIELQKLVKQGFDPNGILNPGKIIP